MPGKKAKKTRTKSKKITNQSNLISPVELFLVVLLVVATGLLVLRFSQASSTVRSDYSQYQAVQTAFEDCNKEQFVSQEVNKTGACSKYFSTFVKNVFGDSTATISSTYTQDMSDRMKAFQGSLNTILALPQYSSNKPTFISKGLLPSNGVLAEDGKITSDDWGWVNVFTYVYLSEALKSRIYSGEVMNAEVVGAGGSQTGGIGVIPTRTESIYVKNLQDPSQANKNFNYKFRFISGFGRLYEETSGSTATGKCAFIVKNGTSQELESSLYTDPIKFDMQNKIQISYTKSCSL